MAFCKVTRYFLLKKSFWNMSSFSHFITFMVIVVILYAYVIKIVLCYMSDDWQHLPTLGRTQKVMQCHIIRNYQSDTWKFKKKNGRRQWQTVSLFLPRKLYRMSMKLTEFKRMYSYINIYIHIFVCVCA